MPVVALGIHGLSVIETRRLSARLVQIPRHEMGRVQVFVRMATATRCPIEIDIWLPDDPTPAELDSVRHQLRERLGDAPGTVRCLSNHDDLASQTLVATLLGACEDLPHASAASA